MRCITGIRYILFFCLISTNSYSNQSVDSWQKHPDLPKKIVINTAQITNTPSKISTPAAPTNAIEAWHVFPLDKRKLFFSFAPVYGSLSDGGASATGYAEVAAANGDTQNYIPKVGIHWGYQASVGYALANDYRYALITTFFSLQGSRTSSVSVGSGTYLFNELTQLGVAGEVHNFGFSSFFGNSTATSSASIGYQRLDFKLQEPWSLKADPTEVFSFYKIKGLMLASINKGLTGYYTGNVYVLDALTTQPGSDSMLYDSNAYGVGPELGLLAFAHLSDRLKIRVEGDGAFLIGYFNSHYTEYGVEVPNDPNALVSVGNIKGTEFSNNEIHPSASWTPVFFFCAVYLRRHCVEK